MCKLLRGGDMNFHQLKLFCAVAEIGSFALASERLHITQPALSIQIRRLERSLGVELMKRTKKGLVLTEAGKAVYDAAKGIFERQDGLSRKLEEIRSGERGTLVVAVSPTGVLYFAASLIRA
ncbi:MAG: LysR family transcriptional regulator, partial [Verrucomicrobia bacterium]|nr:LysR family transcriptional regulator [Verrucomicrobiota bacterium]